MTSTPPLPQPCARLPRQPWPLSERVNVTADLYADGTVRVITLADPEKLNVIRDELPAGLDQEVASAVADTDCRADRMASDDRPLNRSVELS